MLITCANANDNITKDTVMYRYNINNADHKKLTFNLTLSKLNKNIVINSSNLSFILTLFLSSTLKAKIEAHFCCSTMTFGIRFRSGAVESTFLYRSSMFLNLETLSFSHRKPSKVMDRSLVSCEAKNRVKSLKHLGDRC